MSSGILEANGGRHYFEVKGQGSAVILIPAFTLDTRMWDDQFEVYAASHRVVRYDLRGSGKSPAPNGPFTYEDDLASLLDHLGIEKAHVIGVSLGGAIALDFTLVYPKRVLSLVPVAISAVGGYPWHPTIDQWFVGIGAAASQGDMAEAKRLWLETGWFESAMRQPATAEKLRIIAADYSGWHFANKNPVRRPSPPANERLHEVAAPSLIVSGGLDLPYYNLPLAERVLHSILGARELVIAHAGHMTNMEAPAEFNAAVLAFLAEVDRAQRDSRVSSWA
jgi:3-oxoadipate enol-lactonase